MGVTQKTITFVTTTEGVEVRLGRKLIARKSNMVEALELADRLASTHKALIAPAGR